MTWIGPFVNSSLVDARKPGELETRIRRYDGEYRWFLIRIVPQLDAEGNVVRWFGSNTDIEDRKRAENSLEASRLLDEFFESIAQFARILRKVTPLMVKIVR